MKKTSRRNLLKGSAIAGVSGALGLIIEPKVRGEGRESHKHEPIAGPLANATVSFGAWPTSPPLSRFPNVGAPQIPNVHQLIPNEVKIKAGGSVNFIVAGFHNINVYDNGTQPGDINKAALDPTFPNPPGLIDDPNNRIYRGVSPIAVGVQQDRVEVVHFPNPGTYLVICGVLLHFNDGMFGFVKVLS